MRVAILTLLIISSSTAIAEDPLRICTDDGSWFPYIWIENDKPVGLHISIIEAALKELKIKHEFLVRPWKRCLLYSERGKVDTIASASYSSERDEYLQYPPDAAPGELSKWQIGTAKYVVISSVEDPYEFNGDMRQLPGPVRAMLGYSIVNDLKQADLEVFQHQNPLAMYRSLLQTRQGVIVDFEALADQVNDMEAYQDQFRIHEMPLKDKAYYLPFARKSTVPAAQRMKIWNEIASTAMDVRFVKDFFKQLQLDRGSE